MQQLEQDHFNFFDLENDALEDAFYPDGIRISHKEIGQFFYPFMEEKFFPKRESDSGFFRFSKNIEQTGLLKMPLKIMPFQLISLDIWLCPASIGMIATRVKLIEDAELSDVLDFINYFRVLEPQLVEEMGASIEFDGHFETYYELINKKLLPYFHHYLVKYDDIKQYGGEVPFFEDERMYTAAYLQTEDEIDQQHLFRIGQVDGYDQDGEAYISSSNPSYIDQYVAEHVYERWSPNAYKIISNQVHVELTNAHYANKLRAQHEFFSTSYYNLIVHYFYKVMLLKLTFEHSEVSWEKDKFIVDELIEQITKFSSKYYFDEVCVRSEGREISQLLRKQFRIDSQYNEIKETLNELYRVLEDQAGDRQNQLLFVLTVFSMISGIYGMNLVIEGWKDGFTFSDIGKYNFFEWIAFILAVTGLVLSVVFVGSFLSQAVRKKIKQHKRELKR